MKQIKHHINSSEKFKTIVSKNLDYEQTGQSQNDFRKIDFRQNKYYRNGFLLSCFALAICFMKIFYILIAFENNNVNKIVVSVAIIYLTIALNETLKFYGKK